LFDLQSLEHRLYVACLDTDHGQPRLETEPRPDPNVLSQTMRARFGREVFGAQVGMAIERLAQPA
jgi:hypothetical protein